MRVVITGGAGFLGLRLARQLAARGRLAGAPLDEILLFDQAPPPPEAGSLPAGSRLVLGDIADPTAIADLAAGPGPLTVYHLASVVSAGAERDFDLALRVNLDGGQALLDALRRRGDSPRVVFASSVAVFSGAAMGDNVKPLPATTYGMTKAVLELLVNDMSRKGFLDGRTARLPTVIVRPGKPNAAASGWASGLFREPLAGLEHRQPVPPDTRIVVGGYAGVIDNLVRLAELPGEALGLDRALTFPGLAVSAAEMLAALRRVGAGRRLGPVVEAPDAGITAIVRSWPGQTDFARATALGLAADPDLDSILRRYIADYLS
jgi:nucleoside-diphosphate-sugar epimerase